MTTLNFLLAHAVARTLEPGRRDRGHRPRPRRQRLALAARGRATTASWCGEAPIRAGGRHARRRRARGAAGRAHARGGVHARLERARHRSPTPRGSPPPPQRVGALAWADAVHLAPHRRLRRAELGIDVLLCSPYKFFGPHLGVAAIERGLAESLPADRVRPAAEWPPGHRFETGTQSHEAIAGTTAAIDYLRSLGDGGLDAAFERIRDARGGALAPLPRGRRGDRRARPLRDRRPRPRGRAHAHVLLQPGRSARRASWRSELAERDIYVWDGDYYALAPMRALGLSERGAVRAGLPPLHDRGRGGPAAGGAGRARGLGAGAPGASDCSVRVARCDSRPTPRAARSRRRAPSLAGCAPVDVRRLAGDDTAGRNNNTPGSTTAPASTCSTRSSRSPIPSAARYTARDQPGHQRARRDPRHRPAGQVRDRGRALRPPGQHLHLQGGRRHDLQRRHRQRRRRGRGARDRARHRAPTRRGAR